MTYVSLAADPHAIIAAYDGTEPGVLVATSGSTGTPREVLIGSDAIRASVETTERAIGTGHWLLALPQDRIGGALVAARAHAAGTTLTVMKPGRFTPEAFVAAVERLPQDAPLFTSLVPTQVTRILSSPAASDALARFASVLVGGAALHALAPANVVRTYGMTETTGGCVYDGAPLGRTSTRIDDDGRVLLAGPSLADGYQDDPDDPAFFEDDGVRWFRTSDAGVLHDGRLSVLGRMDDVIVTGGHKVHPLPVERALCALPGIADAAVVGVEDAEWGQRVVALVEAAAGAAPDLNAVRTLLATAQPALPRYSLPSALSVVEALPRLAPGKLDRRTARALAAALHSSSSR